MAKKFWPNTDPIGHHFKMATDDKHAIEVVGVTGDARFQGVTGPINPMFYVPFVQHQLGNSLQILQLRTAGAAEAMIREVERVIESLAPQLPLFDVQTISRALDTLNGMLFYKIGAVLAAVLGFLGLVLAIVGVYGVVSYVASQKTHEIGVRMALGAQPLDILRNDIPRRIFDRRGWFGCGNRRRARGGPRGRQFSYGQRSRSVTYVLVTGVLAFVALAACFIPARRAMRVDPMVALRYE